MFCVQCLCSLSVKYLPDNILEVITALWHSNGFEPHAVQIGCGLLRDIKAGEELFTFYGYGWPEGGPDFPEDFPWYWEAKKSIDREERLLQKKKEKKKEEKKKKRKEREKERKKEEQKER